MQLARQEVRELTGTSGDDIADILVSCDGNWQKRGFSSLYGIVFVISYLSGKVIDYQILSKHCAGCQYWDSQDKTSTEYRAWKEKHACELNFTGSSPAMEPYGTLALFQRSLGFRLRYTHLSDGDSKTFSLLQKEAPYGPGHPVTKLDCVGTALQNLKVQYRKSLAMVKASKGQDV